MAQLERLPRSSEYSRSPQAQTSPTFEQLLQGDSSSTWSSSTPTSFDRNFDHEEDSSHHNKKSVLMKVKEKAKKLRHSLSGKKKQGLEIPDENTTPSWGVSLEDDAEEDDIDEDPEYLGAPMYESELAPENYKEHFKEHPRADPVVPGNHSLASLTKTEVEQEKEEPASPSKATTEKTITESVSEKLAPAYTAVSDATHSIASKIAGMTIGDPNEQETETKPTAGETVATQEAPASRSITGHSSEGIKNMETSSGPTTSSPQKWDKGVSVKEYFMQKLEPGQDEKALSQVITEAISPRKSEGQMGVVGKVKEAFTSFIWTEGSQQSPIKNTKSSDLPISNNASSLPKDSNYTSSASSNSHIPVSNSANSSPSIPISTNSTEVVEENNYGRILQAN